MRRKRSHHTAEYKHNRQVLLDLKDRISLETRSMPELERMGIKRSRVLRWEKEGKVKGFFWGSRKKYPLERIQQLSTLEEDLKQPSLL